MFIDGALKNAVCGLGRILGYPYYLLERIAYLGLPRLLRANLLLKSVEERKGKVGMKGINGRSDVAKSTERSLM